MQPLSILFSLLLPSVLVSPLALIQPQSPNLSLLTVAPATAAVNTTNTALSTEVYCFNPTKVPPFLPTGKQDCEAALDSWVRGQSLTQPRKFARKPSTLDDVVLPLQKTSGSCVVYADVLDENDEDVLTLAEVYAELLGPDGVMKQCLGQVKRPPIGGRMTLGAKRLLRVVVVGKENSGVEA